MGLDCSHDAFHGAYSAFNRLRQVVCQAAGGSYPPHWKRNDDGSLLKDGDGLPIFDRSLDENLFYFDDEVVSEKDNPGLFEFLRHSDWDGEISPEMCAKVANDLESLLPEIEKLEKLQPSAGHILAQGGYVEVTKKFIAGCCDAANKNEKLEFR